MHQPATSPSTCILIFSHMRILIGHFREKKIRAFISLFNEDEVQDGQVHKTCNVFKELTEIRLFITFSGTLNRVCARLIQQSRKYAWNKQSLFQYSRGKKKHLWKHNWLQKWRKTIFNFDNLLWTGGWEELKAQTRRLDDINLQPLMPDLSTQVI